MNKNTALFFVFPSVGGAERMTVTIAKLLDRERFDVKFYIVGRKTANNFITDFIPKEYSIKNILAGSPLMVLWELYKALKKEHPDVVFSSRINFNDKILLFKGLFPHTKFIVRCENYLYTYTKLQQHILIGCIYRLADAIIVQTKEMKDELVEQLYMNKHKIHVLENPVDKEKINQSIVNASNPYFLNQKKHFIASGRFSYQKGFDLLVEAFAIVAKKRNDVDLYIMGANDGGCKYEYERIQSIIQEKGLGDLVHCVGFQNNPYPYVKYADCFVLSSRWEGLPNVLIESLYLGTPVAAFKCIPVIQRIVAEGNNGYLAEKDNVKELATAMGKAVEKGRVISTYTGASSIDFIELFNH